MPTTIMRIVVVVAFALCALPLGECAVASEPIGGSIAGTWVVRWEDHPSAPLEVIKIETVGPDIRVQGTSLRGHGSFEGLSGYYEWTLDDGTTGKTTFWLGLHGHVRQSAIDLDFIARRR